MTSEPRRPTEPGPEHDDPFAAGAADSLDDAFAEVEQEVEGSGQSAGAPAEPSGLADADDFANLSIDDADDVFVIDDDDIGAELAGAANAAHAAGVAGEGEPAKDELFGDIDAEMALSSPPLEGVAARAGSADGSVEDELFLPPDDAPISEQFGTASQFEDGPSSDTWGGAALSPEEIGIVARDGDDVVDREGDEEDAAWSPVDEEDLEIVADEEEATAAGDFAVAEGVHVEQFGIQPLDEVEVSAPASGVWDGSESGVTRAPRYARADDGEVEDPGYATDLEAGEESVLRDADEFETAEDEEVFDPIYGAEAEAAEGDGGYQPADEEPDYSEYEESYVQHGHAIPTLVGAPVRRRGRSLALVAAAAVLVLGVAGGFAFMRPEWLGLESSPTLVDRAMIERPQISLVVEAPPPPVQDAETPVVTEPEVPVIEPEVLPVAQGGDPTPPPVDPNEIGPVVVETPPDVKPPVETQSEQPSIEPEPVAQTDPTPEQVGDPTPPVELPSPTPTPVVAKTEDVTRIGDELQIRPAEPVSRPRVHHLAEGLSTGSQAFAQLKNMNFFLGRVKAMDSSYLTLELTPGEITIAFDELNAIVPLASEEYRMMQGSAEGFVRLRNRNKLFGKILNSSLADNVVLEVQRSQVVIPRATIEEVGQQTKASVQVLEDEDADWVKSLLRRQAGAKGNEISVPIPPAPAGETAPARDGR